MHCCQRSLSMLARLPHWVRLHFHSIQHSFNWVHPRPQDADLVVLEFTINERAEAPMTSPERRSYEQVGVG